MKRLPRMLALVMVLVLLPLHVSLAETSEGSAELLGVTYYDSDRNKVDSAQFLDGDDGTSLKLARGETAEMTVELPGGAQCRSVYIRLNTCAVEATLQELNTDIRKYEDVLTLYDPGAEFTFKLAEPAENKLRIRLTFSSSVYCRVLELSCFGPGELPDTLHDWTLDRNDVDIMIAVDSIDNIDLALVQSLTDSGYSLAVGVMNSDAQPPAAIGDILWDAGVRILPGIAATVKTVAELLSAVRIYQPLLLVTDDALADAAAEAVVQAADYHYEVDAAVLYGLWIVPEVCTLSGDVAAKAAALPQRSDELLMQMCVDKFADALSADTAIIPYPEERDEDGYLPEGEFVYENPGDGLWAYLSPTLQIGIVRYTQPDVPSLWFIADVIFDPEQEQFKQYIPGDKLFSGPYEQPDVLAQKTKLVLGINGDFYHYRILKDWVTGIIIRNYTLGYDLKRSWAGYPPLDTMALRDDGSFSLYSQGEITGDELMAQGDVHDALSFGPILVRDGKLLMYSKLSWDSIDPRMGVGLIAPGHYRIIMVEGKMPDDGEQGLDLNAFAELMYSQGVTQGFNLDGGSTAALVFMGVKLNRTGKATFIGSARDEVELFGVGISDLVHTD
ncbi:MAG: phosphodiester glycosidase family protein [Clostridiales bacterium]|nr:phosphodiester glycosidase family protein [Clostridiales bacterium]